MLCFARNATQVYSGNLARGQTFLIAAAGLDALPDAECAAILADFGAARLREIFTGLSRLRAKARGLGLEYKFRKFREARCPG